MRKNSNYMNEEVINTRIVSFHEADSLSVLKHAGEIISKGGLVAFPTETVYGIGANALDPEAVKKIYIAKGRPSDNPLIMHISHSDMLKAYVEEITPAALLLIEHFWPGPLTLVFKKTSLVPSCITGGLNTVAIRMPNHPIAQKIIEYAGVPVAAPSANLSGKSSPTRGKHVIEDLAGRVDMIIDGGKATLGLESTVLDVTLDTPCILRPGSITRSMIEAVIGTVLYDDHLKNQEAIPKAPGMKYKHYAPKGNLSIVTSIDEQKIVAFINQKSKEHQAQQKKVGAIVPSHMHEYIQADLVKDIGHLDDSAQIGSNLFAILREMDEQAIDEIFSFEFKGDELMLSVMNRLNKAASHYIIDLDEVD
jgi:L-threonylcarbamoyladenylate synthase